MLKGRGEGEAVPGDLWPVSTPHCQSHIISHISSMSSDTYGMGHVRREDLCRRENAQKTLEGRNFLL
jgi:hypothetical protein